jgi:hypothetical protein
MSKIVAFLGIFLFLAGLFLLVGWQNMILSLWISELIGRKVGQNWPFYLQMLGFLFFISGVRLIFWRQVVSSLKNISRLLHRILVSLDIFIEEKLRSILRFSTSRDDSLRLNYYDAILVLFFVLIAAFYQLARINNGFPYVLLSSDAANLSSFAAAAQYPHLYQGDLVLSNSDNFRLYATIHIPLLRFLENIVGNFGLAYSILLGPHILMQLVGFYWLGRVLYRSRFWALIFGLMTSATVSVPMGEGWGILPDALPRFTFQIFVVYLLGFAILWRFFPRRWYIIMALAGLMVFIHPVSTPTMGMILLAGFLPFMPVEWSFKQRFWKFIKLGLVFVAALLPYLFIYLSYHRGGTSDSNYDLVYTVISEYFPKYIYDMPAMLDALFSMLTRDGLIWFGLSGFLLTFFFLPSERKNLIQVIFWMLGLYIITILIPWVEQIIEMQFRIIPIQTEIVRGVRYFVPFLIMLWVMPLAGLSHQLKRVSLARGVMLIGILSAMFWSAANPFQPIDDLKYAIDCFAQKRLICPNKVEFSETLMAIRTMTPENAKFAVVRKGWNKGTEIRYLSGRPLVYAFKDKGFLVFSNHDALAHWFKLFNQEREIYRRMTPPEKQPGMAIDFARVAGAEYILTDFPFTQTDLDNFRVTKVYQNGSLLVLKIEQD